MTRYANKRLMHRTGSGQFRRASLEQDFGLRTAICTCGAINPYTRSAPVVVKGFVDPASMNRWERPETCGQCGAEVPA